MVIDNEPIDGAVYGPIFNDAGFFISTPSGVVYYRNETIDTENSWTKSVVIAEINGLNHNYPSGLKLDLDRNYLWTGGPRGINAIDLNTFEVILSKSRRDGMAEHFLWNKEAFDLVDGKIYFGTGKGLIIYNPEHDLERIIQPPAVRIIETDFKNYAFGGNYFSAIFASPSYINESEITFKYRLNGFDQEWQMSGANNSSRYTNLSAFLFPKNYTFQIVAINGDGLESDEPASYTFSVLPPVYLRWWFLLGFFSILFLSLNEILKRKEEKKRQEQEKLTLNRQFETIQRVGASIAHDMKNSVFSLTFLARNLEKRFEHKEFRSDAIDTLQKTTTHLNELIERLQEQKLNWEITLNKSNICDTIQNVIKRVQFQSGGSAIEFQFEEAITWLHDTVAMERIIENLVKNAVEVSPIHGVVSVKVAIKNGKEIEISVSDQGPGMSQEFIQQSLFKPFKTTKKKGLGLGLYSAKELTNAHGGKMSVVSTVGAGSTFILTFPLNHISKTA